MKRIVYSSKGDYEQLKQQERDNYFNDEFWGENPVAPPERLIQPLRRKFKNEFDELLGYVFQIPDDKVEGTREFAERFNCTLEQDPDNGGWYYVEHK